MNPGERDSSIILGCAALVGECPEQLGSEFRELRVLQFSLALSCKPKACTAHVSPAVQGMYLGASRHRRAEVLSTQDH